MKIAQTLYPILEYHKMINVLKKKKIIFHSADSHLWDTRPFQMLKMRKGVLMADDGDIVVSAVPYDRDYVNYLRDLGVLPESVALWSPKEPMRRPSDFFHSQELKRLLREYRQTHSLDVYLPGYLEKNLAEKTGIEMFYNFEVGHKFSDKGHFRRLLKDLNLPVLLGFEFLKEQSEIVSAVRRLFETGSGAVIIKKSRGYAGEGNVRIKRSFFARLDAREQEMYIKMILDHLGHGESFVVEEFLENENASPAILYFCGKDGSYRVEETHDQIFHEGTVPQGFFFSENIFVGSSFPTKFDERLMSDLKEISGRIVDHLTKNLGYFGYCGFDFIIAADGRKFAVDANMRRIMGQYAFETAKKLPMENPHFIYHCYYFPEKLISKFTDAYNLIKPLAFPMSGQERGIIILDLYQWRPNLISVTFLFLDGSAQDLADLKNRFEFYFKKFLISAIRGNQ